MTGLNPVTARGIVGAQKKLLSDKNVILLKVLANDKTMPISIICERFWDIAEDLLQLFERAVVNLLQS